jgi:hypothetical protein
MPIFGFLIVLLFRASGAVTGGATGGLMTGHILARENLSKM